jgi:hypothetical protein
MPYDNQLNHATPFGGQSFYLNGWKSYMDTWPASRWFETLGMNWNIYPNEYNATAAIFKEVGISTIRVEIPWGNVRYDDPTKLTDGTLDEMRQLFAALQANNLRAIILLNGNSIVPCPYQTFEINLTRTANPGDRVVYLGELSVGNFDQIVLFKTGFVGQAYQSAFPLITAFDNTTGMANLSAPLNYGVNEGPIQFWTLKYAPWGGFTYSNGTNNTLGWETWQGWQYYIRAVMDAAMDMLGTAGTSDPGFEVEVWNELTFGSEFLADSNYYNPPNIYSEDVRYISPLTGWVCNGIVQVTSVLLCIVVDIGQSYNPPVKVISGFGNQWPWDSGVGMYPAQGGFSRHYYTGNVDISIYRYTSLFL